MDLQSALEALGEEPSGEPTVIVRLCLMAADDVTGEPRLVSSFLRRTSMPPMLASPHMTLALELLGERRVFRPTQVTWDDTYRVCIVEVEWLVAGDAVSEEIAEAASWPA